MKNTFFAQRLKEARTSQNLTQAELAKKADRIIQIEDGKVI